MTDWEMKVHNFMCLNKFVKKGEIVFTGSSLCELFPISEMLQNVEPRIRVYNRGIGGDNTFGMIDRLPDILKSKPRKIFLMAGINDAPEQVERLADLIEGRYAMVNFIAVNPVEGSGFRRPESAHMQDLMHYGSP